MISGKTIFISPLDWGLGHASRCVPIIKELTDNNKIIIGITHRNSRFFDQYFPDLEKVHLPSYSISYSKRVPLWLKLLLQWPKINSIIRTENKLLQTLIPKHKIDLLISDNRFGMYHKSVHSVFITHQLNVQTPFSFGIANSINRRFIHRFNEVWVPDYEQKSLRLSGQLSDSEGIRIPVKYIGPKSALMDLTKGSPAKKNDVLILLSGPEPQRTVLEEILIKKFSGFKGEIVLVRGSDSEYNTKIGNIRVVNYAYTNELRDVIVNSETVICRSGYSTLMDLHLLQKKKLILIPTPGQTEQEYLAAHWHQRFQATVLFQKDIKQHHFVFGNTV